MVDQKLTERTETISSENESLVHVVKDGVSYKQTKANFLEGVAGFLPTTNVSAIWNSGLIFDVTADSYPVNNTNYSSTAGQVTLDASDATLDRIDLIVATAPVYPANVGTVGKITGTLATTELVVPPNFDPSLVFVIKQVTVKAGATEPNNTTNDLVFDEGTEWTVDYPASYSLVSSNSYIGSKSIQAVNTSGFEELKFTSATEIDTSNVDLITFYISYNSSLSLGLVFRFYLDGVLVSSVGRGMFEPANDSDGSWVGMSITKEDLRLNAGTFNEMSIMFPSGSLQRSYYLDYIRIHQGSGTDNTNKNISQWTNDVPYAKLSDLTGNDYSEWATYSGVRADADLVVTIGAYGGSGAGTELIIDDNNEEITIGGVNTGTNINGLFYLKEGGVAWSRIVNNATVNRTVQLPDASGTVALEADASGFNGNLDTGDTTLQDVAQKFDDYVSTVDGYVTLAGDNTFTGDNDFENEITAIGGLSMSSNKITNLADGTLATDSVNKGQLDAAVSPYQTATDVLDAIKTVDGAGSGLDADLIDGLDSTRFLRSDDNDTATGDITFTGLTSFTDSASVVSAVDKNISVINSSTLDYSVVTPSFIESVNGGTNTAIGFHTSTESIRYTDGASKTDITFDSPSGSNVVNFRNASGDVALTSDVTASRPYEVYTALISQSGTSAPTATILENTLSGTPVLSRNTDGYYLLTLTGEFISNKTSVFINHNAGVYTDKTSAFWTSINAISFRTWDNGTLADDILNNSSIEIRVYN